MVLPALIQTKRSTILKKWFDLIIDTYPPDAGRFLRSQKNYFANPVGGDIRQGIEGLLDGLIAGKSRDEIAPSLDRVIRIRSLQKFTPSQALYYIVQLKDVVRETLAKELQSRNLAEELAAFDARLDDLLFLAFDIFVACRDKLVDIRVNDERRRVALY